MYDAGRERERKKKPRKKKKINCEMRDKVLYGIINEQIKRKESNPK